MCGICGIAGKYDKQKTVIENMMESIRHRGPDGGGSHIDEEIALGFRRLSIIDLDCGNQPMYNENGDIVIVFNGEIYNYQELTRELQEKGHVFSNHSDTECLIHAYEEYHEKMLLKLRGMFGFAIWDAREKTLFAARDFFGIKPFYYAQVNGNLVFASEIKAILEYPEYHKELNTEALSQYLSFQYSAMDETFFKGIYKLNPGCCLKWKNGKLQIVRYFDPTLKPERGQDEKALVEEIKACIEESVEAHKISDVEVGSLLSGGVDSNYIAAQGHFQNTFTVGFAEDNGRYSEIERAREIADFAGSTCHEKLITAEEYWDAVPKVQYYMDEPLADPSAVALWFVDQLAASKLKVVMSGEGADELFGGYVIYHEPVSLRPFRVLSDKTKKKIKTKLENSSRSFKGKNYILRGCTPVEERFIGNAYIFHPEEKAKVLKKDIPVTYPEKLTKECYNKTKKLDETARMQYIDLKFWLIGDILLKADKMSMAHSLETRVPYLDVKVFQTARKVSFHNKIRKTQTKYAFRMAAHSKLPEQVSSRKKLGFPVPIRVWLRQKEYYDKVRAVLESDVSGQFFQRDYLVKLLDDHYHGAEDNSRKIWTIYTFLVWYDIYFGEEKTA
ncbi:MAG: asparagine synthase (glutamine-hydrolyzing) [Hominisplanchenecus sp.]|nr:asparagine synthase (glutamine-hydrolyzing) [Lachnospiraceae bacterium]MDY2819497.1 asparagine synthase (glutamine-hydrolyzing) [Hominisplanchenecus sp.]